MQTVNKKEDKHSKSYKQAKDKPDKLVSALCLYFANIARNFEQTGVYRDFPRSLQENPR
jgi:hypothetical protein